MRSADALRDHGDSGSHLGFLLFAATAGSAEEGGGHYSFGMHDGKFLGYHSSKRMAREKTSLDGKPIQKRFQILGQDFERQSFGKSFRGAVSAKIEANDAKCGRKAAGDTFPILYSGSDAMDKNQRRRGPWPLVNYVQRNVGKGNQHDGFPSGSWKKDHWIRSIPSQCYLAALLEDPFA